jgi:hypothetical protein
VASDHEGDAVVLGVAGRVLEFTGKSLQMRTSTACPLSERIRDG